MLVICVLVLVGLTQQLTQASEAPSIITHPQNTTAKEWETITVHCNVSGNPEPTVTWWKDNQLLSISGRLTQDSSNSLTITNITRADKGFYYCNSTNNVSSTVSHSAYITVNYPPSIKSAPSNVTKIEKQSATFNCDIDAGIPISTVTWLYEGALINTNDGSMKYSVITPSPTSDNVISASLTINNLTRDEAGTYQCKANNSLNNAESDRAFLVVQFLDQPMLTKQPSSVVPVENSKFTLTCIAEGLPVPSISWYRDSQPFGSLSPTVTTNVTTMTSQLIFNNIKRGDKGKYSCRASNIAGTKNSSEVTVDVHYPPSIEASPQNVTKNESQSVTFTCTVSGNPIPQITWWYNNVKINTIDSAKYSVSGPSSASSSQASLTINNLKRDEAGSYQCKANNSLGNAESNRAFLVVQFLGQPMLTKQPSSDEPVENSKFTLTCIAEGLPVPSISWYRDSQPFESLAPNVTTNLTSITSQLIFNNIKRGDKGKYSCRASNIAGTKNSSEVTFDVHYKPEIFVNPRNETRNEGENVTLWCELNTGNPPAEITWKKDGNPIGSDGRRSITKPSVAGLRANTTLTIKNVNRDDKGTYTCNASNIVDNNVESLYSAGYLEVNYPLSIEASPQNVTKNESQSVTFTCTVSGNPIPQITWWYNGTKMNTANSVKYSVSGPSSASSSQASLTINNLTRDEAGTYQCRAKNILNNAESNRAFLVVQFLDQPMLTKQPSSGVPVENNKFTLTCIAEGVPVPSISWYRDSQLFGSLAPNVTTNLTSITSQLIFNNIKRDDKGQYSCRASNNAGTKNSSEVTFDVHYKPEIFVNPRNETRNEGENVALWCELNTGNPSAEITWMKNGNPIGSDSRRSITKPSVAGLRANTTLTINNVNRDDNGTYTCKASNIVDNNVVSLHTAGYLEVNYPPSIEVSPQNVTKNESQSVTFTCTVSGNPIPQITWLYNDEKINTSDSAKYSVFGLSSASSSQASLMINNLTRDEAGTYQCRAKNSLNNTESDRAFLVVQFLDQPLLTKQPSSGVPVENSKFTLTCIAEGLPVPSISWYRDGQLFESLAPNVTTNLTSITSQLIFNNIKRGDKGKYSCRASNNAGTKNSSEVTFDFHYKPEIFVNPRNETRNEGENVTLWCELNTGNPSAEITWMKNGNPIGSDGRRSITKPSVAGLRANTTLTINNVDRNDNGTYTCTSKNDVANVVSLLGAGYLEVNYPARVLVSPKNQTLIENSNVTFSCYVEGNPAPQVTWFWDGKTLANSGKYMITQPTSETKSSSSLTIINANRTDEGHYYCNATNVLGTGQSTRGLLTIHHGAKIRTNPSNETRNEGQSVTLWCEYEGNPPPTVTWTKDGAQLSNNNIKINTTSKGGGQYNSTLSISDLKRDDEGTYRCTVNNTNGTNVSSPDAGHLIVNYGPKIITHPLNETRNESQSVVFSCEYEGKPLTTVTWKKGNEVIANGGRRTITNPSAVGRATSTLTITNLNRTDEGLYSCTVDNSVGNNVSSLSSRGYLTINYRSRIFKNPRNETRNESQSVMLSCEYEGKPLATVTWTKDGDVITNGGRRTITNPSTVGRATSTLTIENLNRTDEGLYTCTVKNAVGTVVSTIAHLTVNYQPKIFTLPLNETRNESQSVTFSCNYDGRPLNTVTWTKGGDVIADGDRTTITNPSTVGRATSILTIDNLFRNDEGLYTCTVKNAVGTVVSTIAYLTVNYNARIFTPPRSETRNEGQSVTLSCEYEGKPLTTVTWTKDGNIFTNGGRRTITNSSAVGRATSTLTIDNLNRTDEGLYTCTVNNTLGTVVSPSSTGYLTINYDPKIFIHPVNETRNESQSVMLSCEYEGKPLTTVTWTKDGETITNASRITISKASAVGRATSTLTITNLNRTDEGLYTCTVKNAVGNVTSPMDTGYLSVNYQPKIFTLPVNETRNESQSVTFSCNYDGRPLNTVTWTKGGDVIADGDRTTITNPSTVGRATSILTIDNLFRNDEGLYTCTVKNAVGTVVSTIAYLTVNYNARIFTPPRSETRNEGQSVTLSCEYEGKPLTTVTWTKDGNIFTNGGRRTITNSSAVGRATSTLTIDNLNRTDEGLYTCTVNNTLGTVVSPSSTGYLTINYDPKIFIHPVNETRNESQSVMLSCEYEGKPLTTVTWTKDGETITNASRITISKASAVGRATSTLTITNLNRTDEGLYTCTVKNAVGNVTSPMDTGYLSVNYQPKIFTLPVNETRNESQSVTFSCNYDGRPLNTVTWTKGGDVIADGDRTTITNPSTVGRATSILTIDNLFRNDEGLYTCTVKNAVGTVVSTIAYLTVNYNARIFTPPRSETRNEGQSVTLSCEYEGKPLTTVTWTKDGNIFTNGGRRTITNSSAVGRATSTLTIDNLNRTDEGLYTCTVSNTLGTVVSPSSTGYLTINYDPKIFIHPVNETRNESQSVMLSCEYEGKPLTTVAWTKDGETITNASRITISKPSAVGRATSTLTITNLNRTDEGLYTCTVKNAVGNVTSPMNTGYLSVNYHPKIFTHPLNETRNESQSVVLSCEYEGKPLAIVTWKKDGEVIADGGRRAITNPSAVGRATSTLTITNLNRTDEGLYTCTVKNAVGTKVSNTGYLTVNFMSRIFSNPRNETKIESQSVTLSCEYEGKPSATVTWKKGGVVITNAGRRTITNPSAVGRATSTLTITNLNRTDEGLYTCTVDNSVGNVTSLMNTGYLTVNYAAEKISLETNSYDVPINESFQLLCKGGGKPRPEFTWTRDGKSVTSRAKILGKDNAILRVDNAMREDGGIYTCFGYNGIGKKSQSSTIVITVNETKPQVDFVPSETSISIKIHNDKFTKLGKKICYSLIYVSEGLSRPKYSENNYTQAIKKNGPSSLYVTGLIDINQLERFIVGNGETYPNKLINCGGKRKRRDAIVSPTGFSYVNKKLEPGKTYSFLQRAETRTKGEHEDYGWTPYITTKEPEEPPSENVGGIVAGVLAAIVVICIIVVIVIYLHRRKRDNDSDEDGVPMQNRRGTKNRLNSIARMKHSHAQYISGNVFSAKEFERHVNQLHSNSDLLFSQEYSTVQSPGTVTITNSLQPEQKPKNRYNNIAAFDHTRVVLSTLEGDPSSHYINANYLDGFSKKREYIAAQGPLPHTCDDFWRMIWERGSKLIVMVTNCEEKGRIKCHQYWPSSGSMNFGRIEVTILSTVELSHYTIRSFQVKMQNIPEQRQITQYHYTAWPDHGVPSSVTSVLNFVRKASGANPPDAGPMVVHCSAGVGRTGTFIVIDAQLKRIAAQGDVDVYNYVMHLRTQRNLMVQVEDQYILIHDVLVEAIACGNTEIQARDLRKKIRALMRPNEDTGQTSMEKQFQLLSRNKAPPSKFLAANLPVNKNKNRYANVLPYDDTRVHLTPQPGADGSDYINANYIDGYMQKRLFIATQAPIPDTIPDFWRMIWEQDCSTIVMLSNETQSGKVKVHRYWPGKAPTTIANLVIEMTSERAFEDYVMREFKVTNTGESASRTVRQYHYTAWPDIGSPDSSAGLTDLIGQVQKWQQRCGAPLITVHCSAGVGRTGVFCAVCSLIERLKAEALVDVFTTVKLLREQRPAMVQTKDQYEFCYQTLGEYLDSFDPYNNFD